MRRLLTASGAGDLFCFLVCMKMQSLDNALVLSSVQYSKQIKNVVVSLQLPSLSKKPFFVIEKQYQIVHISLFENDLLRCTKEHNGNIKVESKQDETVCLLLTYPFITADHT
jgi:hypothetical protein